MVLRDPRLGVFVEWLSLPSILLSDLSTRLFITEKLIALFTHLRTLHRLDILSLESLLDASPHLQDRILSLTVLTYISFEGMSDKSIALVSSLTAPITTAYLRFVPFSASNILMTLPDISTRATRRPMQHITTLTLSYPPMLVRHQDVYFPHLHILRLERYDGLLSLDVLTYMFPNLKRFAWVHQDEPLEWNPVEDDELRASNATVLHGVSDTETPTWEQLEELECRVRFVYTLALSCRTTFWRAMSLYAHRVPQFREVMRCIRPTYLQVRFEVDSFADLYEMANAFWVPWPAAYDVTCLEITFAWAVPGEEIAASQLINAVGSCLRPLESLTTVSILFAHPNRDLMQMTIPLNGLGLEYQTNETTQARYFSNNQILETCDTGVIASQQTYNLPNISFVSIGFQHGQQPRSYWRANKTAFLGVERIEESVGREMLRTQTPFTFDN
ncbi:hypothetical protein EIP91_011428 [Steccherinum ochraceum]|uniref:F-box domain-containing protein n=1 Tax=Steccherinum ochraceum TaxID=92696 RepID=A0A4R0RHX5_9APHY|nr:hypothetical protein EIP91_011428 [Steccherinum ochraceum]